MIRNDFSMFIQWIQACEAFSVHWGRRVLLIDNGFLAHIMQD